MDNISPIYNINILNGFITDFDFQKAKLSSHSLNTSSSFNIYVANDSGEIYYQELKFKTYGEQHDENKMDIDDNS